MKDTANDAFKFFSNNPHLTNYGSMKVSPKECETDKNPEPMKIADIAIGKKVLRKEAEGLLAVANNLDENFGKTLKILKSARGRIVVTGMGKSGHIAAKIAATLASLGTPAQYVNAAEASHGDLGMITSHDVVLALSNSGNTAELTSVANFTQMKNIPLVAIISKANSMLGRIADISITLGDIEEACPLGLAPTTSSTAMLALGDSLAIALASHSNFSSSDFNALHPGGHLGRQFMRVGDLMHTGEAIPLVKQADNMSQALLEITTKSFGCVGILDENKSLMGIITDGDLRRHMDKNLLARFAFEIMTAKPQTVTREMLCSKALEFMNDLKITSLFVVEKDHKPSGILHIHDLLRTGLDI